MRMIRFFFTKTGEAAYISLLDLQRVMARSLRKSGIPVWYSMGFNPHIYMTFSLPLSLMQESVAETMDCKTEAEDIDFSKYIEPLNQALPRGIVVSEIKEPVFKAGDIAQAEYDISYPGRGKELAEGIDIYTRAENALVVRKTKRSENEIDLKEIVPQLQLAGPETISVLLPAGGGLNCNPELFVRFLEREANLPGAAAHIMRKGVFVKTGESFV